MKIQERFETLAFLAMTLFEYLPIQQNFGWLWEKVLLVIFGLLLGAVTKRYHIRVRMGVLLKVVAASLIGGAAGDVVLSVEQPVLLWAGGIFLAILVLVSFARLQMAAEAEKLVTPWGILRN